VKALRPPPDSLVETFVQAAKSTSAIASATVRRLIAFLPLASLRTP